MQNENAALVVPIGSWKFGVQGKLILLLVPTFLLEPTSGRGQPIHWRIKTLCKLSRKAGVTSLQRGVGVLVLLILLPIRAIAGQASLVWDPSPDPRVAAYMLHYGQASHSYTATIDVGSQTTYTVPNLLEGHNYYFAVAARDSSGTQGPVSNEVSAFITASGITLGTVLASAVLPASRAARVGSPITVYASTINAGSSIGTGCSIGLISNIPAAFGYQTTDSATNTLTGAANARVDIVPGASQSFVVSLTPSAAFGPTDVQFQFSCANAGPAGILTGVNTLLLSASNTPTPDVIALVATTTGDGIANIPGPSGTGAFAVASANVGSTGSIVATADTGSAALPVSLTLCQTNPSTSVCLQAPARSVSTSIATGETPTLAVFIGGTGAVVPFNPATNRVFVRFLDSSNGAVVGATSVAIKTQ